MNVNWYCSKDLSLGFVINTFFVDFYLGLFPAILNLASNADITTNATCGDPVPEMYCKLVEHVPGRRIRNPQCRICDANSTNSKGQSVRFRINIPSTTA